jgi:hypothetical protein
MKRTKQSIQREADPPVDRSIPATDDINVEIDAPDATDTDEDIDEHGLPLIGGAVTFAPDERDEPAPVTEGSSGESPAEIEQEGEWEWPDEKTPVYRSTAERAGR